jgi:protein-L-isoaspartate O-methyltransferase
VTTTLDTDWTTYARRLADTLRDNGDLRCPAWHAAVAAVPRHLLVPRAFEQDSTGAWSEFTTADAPQRVYSPETLITALETVGAHQQPMSSSTKPDLMVRMLEILDIQDGHRVLEIGTGTGYNAALPLIDSAMSGCSPSKWTPTLSTWPAGGWPQRVSGPLW